MPTPHSPFRIRTAIPLIAMASCFAPARSTFAAPAYTILDLGTLGGTTSQADGFGTLNASGQVVGFSTLAGDAVMHAFRTRPNAPITADSDLNPSGGPSVAYSINDSGQVVGDFAGHAFRTAPGGGIDAASDLGTLGGTYSHALAINSSGQAVGYSYLADNVTNHAFRTTPGGVIDAAADLGSLGGGYSEARAINNKGQVAGVSSSKTGLHAFRTAPNSPISPADDLGTLGGAQSFGGGINDLGQVVGASFTDDKATTHAFRTAPNQPINPATDDLGTLGGTFSSAYAINSSGQTVGTSRIAGDKSSHAFFSDPSAPMRDLNDLVPAANNWTLIEAHGINDSGQIAGLGTINGHTHAFLLTPARPGDANGDTKVDFNDLVILAQNYNASGGAHTWWTGDFTGDGNVNFNDLVALAQNYNNPLTTLPGNATPAFASDFERAMTSVPEPLGTSALTLAAFVLTPRRRPFSGRRPRRAATPK